MTITASNVTPNMVIRPTAEWSRGDRMWVKVGSVHHGDGETRFEGLSGQDFGTYLDYARFDVR